MAPSAILYSKPDCHLCDLAAEILDALARSDEVTWRRANILSDAALTARYEYEIPVIAVQGGAELKWPTTLERVRRALRACQ